MTERSLTAGQTIDINTDQDAAGRMVDDRGILRSVKYVGQGWQADTRLPVPRPFDKALEDLTRWPGGDLASDHPSAFSIDGFERVQRQVGRDVPRPAFQGIGANLTPQGSEVVVHTGSDITSRHPNEATDLGLENDPPGDIVAIADQSEKGGQGDIRVVPNQCQNVAQGITPA